MTLSFASPLCSLAAFFLGYGVALGAAPKPTASSDNPVPVSMKNKEIFADMRAQLQAVVNTSGFHLVNRFCVVGYRAGDDNSPLVYIYWPIQNKIISWDSGSNQPILEAGQFSDLRRDILPDGEVTDDYLHKSDVKSILNDCWNHGSNYTIFKTTGDWVSISKFAQFSSVNTQLQYLADHNTLQKINNFCVIGQKDGAFLVAYVYWETGDQLFMWWPDKYDVDDPFAVADSVVQIDLKSGLRDEEDANDNRNEMQRSYADAILKACQKYGQKFVVTKSN